MFKFLKQILLCFGCIEIIDENKYNNLDNKYQYQPEGNRFIYNRDL